MDLKRKNYESMPAPTKKPHTNEEFQKPPIIAEEKEIDENPVESDGDEEEDQEIDKDEILREILEVL